MHADGETEAVVDGVEVASDVGGSTHESETEPGPPAVVATVPVLVMPPPPAAPVNQLETDVTLALTKDAPPPPGPLDLVADDVPPPPPP